MPIPSDFAYYEIYRSTSIDGAFSLIGTSLTSDFVDTTGVVGNTYCYKIVTVDLFGNKSESSNITCVFFSKQGGGGSSGGGGSGGQGSNQQTIANPTAIFSKDNIVCVYRMGDADSLASALRYQEIHSLDDDQLIAIPCSNIEILSDYLSFQSEVEDPVRTALTSDPVNNRSVYAIILMPYVPGGFRDGSDVISTTSRLSRIFHSFVKNQTNPIYNRQVFKRFTGLDAFNALLCSRIDGPNIVSKTWLDNIEIAKGRLQAGGKFYLDPYSAYSFSGASDYTAQMVDFSNNYINRLGITVQRTTQSSPSRDPFFSQIEDDSFFWGWGADRGSLSYFKTTTNMRAFFYNADFVGGITMRNLDANYWPILAIREGYIATAGCMSGSSADAFLRPVPFMDALFRGATMGEAMFFSQPLVNSPLGCFGDPLSILVFPVPFEESTLIQVDRAWQSAEDCLAESVACIYRKTNILSKLRDYIASGTNVDIQEELIYPFEQLSSDFDDYSWKNDYVNLAGSVINFVVDRNVTSFSFAYPNLNQYLTHTGNKMASIVLETLQDPDYVDTIETANIEVIGSWKFIADIEHYSGTFRFYHFDLQIVKEFDDFETESYLVSKDTLVDTSNWYYEDYNGVFQSMGANGITSNYEGRKVKYINQENELLKRGETYWFRIRQKDDLEEFPWRYSKILIYL